MTDMDKKEWEKFVEETISRMTYIADTLGMLAEIEDTLDSIAARFRGVV